MLTTGAKERRFGRDYQNILPGFCLSAHKLDLIKGEGEDNLSALTLSLAVKDSATDSVIDEEHLQRMTLSDPRLEREVLQIFIRQTALILERIMRAEPAIATAAHTLKGSARGIGAWRVARAAEQLECAVNAGDAQRLEAALAELKNAALEAGAAISARLGHASARAAISAQP